jgi:coenzyme F420 hydrogenase subunit beta
LSKPLKIFGTLVKEVVQTDLCMFCGACMAACPVNVLFPTDEEKPTIKGICVLCQMCYYSCPRIELPIDTIETRIFGRTRLPNEGNIGIIRASYIARSKDEEILKVAQDGGVVTSLLAHAIETGLVDYAVGTTKGSENPWRPKPAIMKSREQLLSSAGTKVTASGSLASVAEAWLGYPDSKLAFVGLPCQIQALRRVLTTPQGPRKYGESVELALGLFCNNSYRYNKLLLDYLKTKKNQDLQTITKMRLDAKDDVYRIYKDREMILEGPTKEIEPCLLAACSRCNDFTSELADVSIGANGAPEGWCTMLVRTEKGEALVSSAIEKNVIEVKPFVDVKDGLSVISEISAKKKKREASYISHTV